MIAYRGQLWTVIFACACVAPARAEDDLTPAASLQKLQIGHARYLCGKSDHPRSDAEARLMTFTRGQRPFAAVLSCADSRLPVETLFDQGIGDLFVIRVAGNVCDRQQLGSLEYAAEHLHVPLVVVMGHRGCGAVGAALSAGEPHGNLASIVQCIRPAVEQAERANPQSRGEALFAEAIKANVFRTIQDIFSGSPMLAQLARTGKLNVVGAVYDIETGTIMWLGAHPDELNLLTGSSAAASNPAGRGESPDRTVSPKGEDAHGGGALAETGSAGPKGTTSVMPGDKGGPSPALPKSKSDKPAKPSHD